MQTATAHTRPILIYAHPMTTRLDLRAEPDSKRSADQMALIWVSLRIPAGPRAREPPETAGNLLVRAASRLQRLLENVQPNGRDGR